MIRVSVAIAILGLSAALFGAQVQAPVFRAGTDIVPVNVSVKKDNLPVQGLTAADFRLYDNDVLQELSAVSVDAIPVDLSLVVNTVTGYPADLNNVREAVRGIVALLRPSDRFRVLTMGNAVINAIPWRNAGTPDLSALSMESGLGVVADAVLMALLHRTPPDRRHLVLALTDGHEWCSVATGDSLMRVAERSGSVLHWINVERRPGPKLTFDPLEPKPETPSGRGVSNICRGYEAAGLPVEVGPALAAAAGLTGGTARTAWFKADRIAVEAFDEIFDDFRRSYVLHYVPTGVARTGWHRLRVEVTTKGLTVRARSGYWISADTPR